ncbi:MAG: hypothetical protein ABIP06_02020 [Pyrinomonadaceae bacterium]
MNRKWINKVVSLCLTLVLLATYSMSVSAKTDRIAGELTISGKLSKGETPAVLVNGEAAQNGRSVFSSSTINTPADASAIINIAKLGKIELAPNTNISISFDEAGINGDLINGKITVLGATADVNIKTPNGQIAKLAAGESATAGNAKDDDDDNDSGGAAWWLYALIFGGAVAGLVIAATTDNNRAALGGGTTVVSPLR